tara:strand:+ start:224 stop:631 length:408 start_codon:yes stop_codon:yes gene_type:complete
MLLEPTDKYINYIHRSAHYMTSPKCRFNEDINSMCRGYNKEKSFGNLVVLFNLASYRASGTLINDLVEFHHSTHIQKFNKMNVDQLTAEDEKRINRRNEEIDVYIKKHTTYYSALFGGGVNYRPSFPFQDYLKRY